MLAGSQSGDDQARIRVSIQMRDGSRIFGYPAQDSVTLQTRYATLKLDWALFEAIDFASPDGPVTASLNSGERLNGMMLDNSLNVRSILGPLTISLRDISHIRVHQRVSAPDSGLAAFYPFSGDAGDKSGHGADGSAIGTKLCSDRFGNLNSAYCFDGDNSYVSIPDRLIRHDIPSFSISAWLLAREVGGRRMAIYLSPATGEAQLQMIEHRMNLSIKFASRWCAVEAEMPFDTWVHVVAVYRRGTSCQLWINGEAKAESRLPAENLFRLRDGYRSSIGSYSPSHFDYADANGIGSWQGSIDEVRIYARALEPEEIRNLFTVGD